MNTCNDDECILLYENGEPARFCVMCGEPIKESRYSEPLECPHCEHSFKIENDYMGVITCPYCGEYVEG